MYIGRLSTAEKRKEIRRLQKNLSRRIKNIEGLGASAPQYAVNKFREIEKNIPLKLTKLNASKIDDLYRDLKYVSSLKSSTVKGAKEVQEKFEPIHYKINALSEDKRKTFWEIYDKLYSAVGATLENFKYEVLEANVDLMYSGKDDEAIINDIIESYKKSYEGGETDEDVRILFSEELQKLL